MTDEQREFLLTVDLGKRKCKTCGKDMGYIQPARLMSGRGVYCSKKCAKGTLFKKGEKSIWKGQHHSQQSKDMMSVSHTGKTLSDKHKKNISIASRGKVIPPEVREKISKAHTGMKKPWSKFPVLRGDQHGMWKGGVERRRPGIGKWRRDVLVRDEYTCQLCGFKHIHVEAHHLNSYTKFPTLRFNVDNGVTLCKDCHKYVHQELRKEGGA